MMKTLLLLQTLLLMQLHVSHVVMTGPQLLTWH